MLSFVRTCPSQLARVAVCVLAAIAIPSGCAYRFGSVAPPSGSASERRLVGQYEVATFDDRFDAVARPDASGDDAVRPLRTRIWYPIDAGDPRPLVVFVHGFLSNRLGGRFLAQHLAERGYVVVSADHPRTRRGASGGADVNDVVNQPRDVSATIDRVMQQSATGAPLARRVDLARIAVVGHSLGGLTATLAAFHPELRDPRLAAVVSIGGPFAFFTPRFFEGAKLPFLMIAGTADVIVDYTHNARPVLDRVPGSGLLSISDGSHAGFDDKVRLLRLVANPDRIACIALSRLLDPSKNKELIHRLGGVEAGLELVGTTPLPCERAPPSRSMDPVRQQLITQLAVAAFLDAQFADDQGVRSAAANYLAVGLPYDFPMATFEGRVTGEVPRPADREKLR